MITAAMMVVADDGVCRTIEDGEVHRVEAEG